jgi:hypothetical protein
MAAVRKSATTKKDVKNLRCALVDSRALAVITLVDVLEQRRAYSLEEVL